MTTTDLAVLGSATYSARVTPLRSGGRVDMEVTPLDADAPRAFADHDILDQLRRFFSALEQEAHSHKGDPVATGQALARLEALLADVRSVRDSLKALTASALAENKVRRLTIAGVTTIEGTTEVKRTDWQHFDLLSSIMSRSSLRLINVETGEVLTADKSSELLLGFLRPDWKMTPLKDLGIDPDDFCHVETDDDGKPVRTPAVRMVDNLARRSQVTK
jgi:hypothetical protein